MTRPDDRNEEVSTYAHVTPDMVTAEDDQVHRVVIVEGPDAGASFDLDPYAPARLLIGTSVVCGIRLTDPSVSRRHAALEPAGARRYRLTDLGSTNGTFVDGVSVVDAYVRGDELVRVGSTALRIERSGAAPGGKPTMLPSAVRFGRVQGASVAMRRIYPLCERLAAARIPVLIEGETGTGKELVAEAMYEVGGSVGPFVVFDCTTVSPALMEAELFGHERGAFTGADATRKGIFEEANGGTLLIDELGDLELPLQAKLLRVLDRGEVRRVGANNPIKVNVRVLAATRRDLDRAIQVGQFRDDLYHRLAVARVEVPPLRQRHGDVTLLARLFAKEFGIHEIPQATLSRFEDYTWPGNVRELRNAVARFAALGVGSLEMLGEEAFRPPPSSRAPPSRAPPSRAPPSRAPSSRAPASSSMPQAQATGGPFEELFALPFAVARKKAQDEFDREYVERVLRQHGGSVTHAARASGVALRYFRLVKARTHR